MNFYDDFSSHHEWASSHYSVRGTDERLDIYSARPFNISDGCSVFGLIWMLLYYSDSILENKNKMR